MLGGRGMRIALRSGSSFHAYLAAGLTAYLVAQSVLIIGGNLRLLPLTGVTLPFVSYGGTSLLTSLIALLFLIHISSQSAEQLPVVFPSPRPYLLLAGVLFAGLASAALVLGWWSFYRAPALVNRTDNPRRAIADRFVPRGAILARDLQPVTITTGDARRYTGASTCTHPSARCWGTQTPSTVNPAWKPAWMLICAALRDIQHLPSGGATCFTGSPLPGWTCG